MVEAIPFIENRKTKCHSFLVSWFQSFKAPWLQSSRSFKDPKTLNICWKIVTPSYHKTISCFLEEIDPVYKIFKQLRRTFTVPIFSNIFKIDDFQNVEISRHDIRSIDLGFSWIIWSVLVSPKIIILVWEPWVRPNISKS